MRSVALHRESLRPRPAPCAYPCDERVCCAPRSKEFRGGPNISKENACENSDVWEITEPLDVEEGIDDIPSSDVFDSPQASSSAGSVRFFGQHVHRAVRRPVAGCDAG